MIVDKEKLFGQIDSYKIGKGNESLSTTQKIKLLDEVITNSVIDICKKIMGESNRVHLAYSGGIDSSTILVKIVATKFPITAHTMVVSEKHPDLVYAKSFIEILKNNGIDIEHKIHILTPSNEDLKKSNQLLCCDDIHPDNYYLLMKVIGQHTNNVVCCDCIDELLCGYHMHRDPKNFFPFYTKETNLISNRIAALNYYISRLIPDHLLMMEVFSNYFGVKVYLPYGREGVIKASKNFKIGELVDSDNRKKPIHTIAKQSGVSSEILIRRKYGLVSAFHDCRC